MPDVVTYAGSMRWCGNPEPHLPHGTGGYSTVRHGRLDKFCPGLPGPGAAFKVIGYLPGNPLTPTVLRWTSPDGPAKHNRYYLGERQGEEAQKALDGIYASIQTRSGKGVVS